MIPLLIACMILLFTCQSSFARLYTEQYAGPNEREAANIYSMIYGAVIALATLALNRFRFAPGLPTVLLGLANGAVLILYTISLVNGSVRGPYAFLMFSQLSGGIVVPMLYNMLFLGERLSLVQLVGIGVMLVSFFAMNMQGMTFQGGKPQRAFFLFCALLFLTNGFYGQLMNVQQVVSKGAQRTEMIACTYASSALYVLVYWLLRKPRALAPAFRMGKKALMFALLACCMSTGATNIMVYLIPLVASPTVMFAINNGGVLALSCLYAIFLFHEKPTVSQLVGIVLAVVSIVMLSL